MLQSCVVLDDCIAVRRIFSTGSRSVLKAPATAHAECLASRGAGSRRKRGPLANASAPEPHSVRLARVLVSVQRSSCASAPRLGRCLPLSTRLRGPAMQAQAAARVRALPRVLRRTRLRIRFV